MHYTNEESRSRRLDDFIALAEEGQKIDLVVELREELATQKIHPGEDEEMKRETGIYLLIGNYHFEADGLPHKVSKVYMFGCSSESIKAKLVDKNIANERLKMDYRRLKESNIAFEEIYFE